MENTTPKNQLENHATLIRHEVNGMLQSFDVVNPPSKNQPSGSTLHFNLTQYSRPNASAESNKVLGEEVYKAAMFLSENVPAFTTLTASISASGAKDIALKNPDANRFGIAEIPGITEFVPNTEVKIDPKQPVIMVGNLDNLTKFSQVGYESRPKNFIDQHGKIQDFRPAVMLLQELTMASKDLQHWPLTLAYEYGKFVNDQNINNVMKASFFVEYAIKFSEDDTPTLDELRSGSIPDRLKGKGYPEPTIAPTKDIHKEKENLSNTEVDNLSVGMYADRIVSDTIAHNLGIHLKTLAQLEVNKQNYLSV